MVQNKQTQAQHYYNNNLNLSEYTKSTVHVQLSASQIEHKTGGGGGGGRGQLNQTLTLFQDTKMEILLSCPRESAATLTLFKTGPLPGALPYSKQQ